MIKIITCGPTDVSHDCNIKYIDNQNIIYLLCQNQSIQKSEESSTRYVIFKDIIVDIQISMV